MGALGWPPAAFWAATLHECFAAIEGLQEFNGAKPPPVPDKEKRDAMLLKYPDPPQGRRL
jgi:hypothetical protein